jgi:Peptidase_G2, IMC autoproteolytic cleavage domain
MKKYLLWSVLVLIAAVVQVNVQAQEIAQGIQYQAVARNASNQPLANIPLVLKISITGEGITQPNYYTEQQEVKTDEQGLFSIVIGQGQQKNGQLADVPWAMEKLWMKVEVSGDQQKSFSVLSHTRIMAVPYAMHAATASALAPQQEDSPIEKNRSIYWTTGGNTGTSPATHFLGTRDNKDLYLKTNNTTRVILTKEGQMQVKSGVSGLEDIISSYPVVVQGSNQGIYIQVTGSRSNDNNFMTFADDVNTIWWGAVEGQTVDELEDTWQYKLQIALFALEGVSAAAQAVEEVATAVGEIASGLAAAAAIGSIGSAAAYIVKAAALINNAVEYTNNTHAEVGVSFSTGAADYAEWLERKEGEPKMRYGQVVGIKGGKISLNTSDADHIRVISSRPGVIGNQPAPSEKAKYEKVAFMGQVMVKVAGPVAVGDYIIPSGNHDGYGFAVNPKQMKIGDYTRIVGVAWEAAQDAPVNVIKVAIGIGSNQLGQEIEVLEKKIRNIKGYLKGQNPLQAGQADFAELEEKLHTRPQKILSDEAFDQMLDQQQGVYKKLFAQVKSKLLEQKVDINAIPRLNELLDNPVPMIKELRRDPSLVTQWALLDQKLFGKK